MDFREGLEYLFYAAIVALINIGPPQETGDPAQENEPAIVADTSTWAAPAHKPRTPEGFFLGNQQ